jgi:hypothetical protein
MSTKKETWTVCHYYNKTNNMPLSICPYRPYRPYHISSGFLFLLRIDHVVHESNASAKASALALAPCRSPRALKWEVALEQQLDINQVSTRFQGKSQDIPSPQKSSIVALRIRTQSYRKQKLQGLSGILWAPLQQVYHQTAARSATPVQLKSCADQSHDRHP